MPNLKDIRARITSTKNTQQITKAMKMVSAVKLRKAQQNITNMRPYAKKLLQVIADIAASHRVEHPLLATQKKYESVLLVVLTSDRGLCGGFNANITRAAVNQHEKLKQDFEKIDFLFIGKKAAEFFKVRGIKPVDTILNLTKDVSYEMAADTAKTLMHDFLDGQYDSIYLVYNEFKSAIQQNVVLERLLPIQVEEHTTFSAESESEFARDLVFEPNPEEIIEELIGKHFNLQVYRCMSESVAAEHAARMTAMENATKNAQDVIQSLTLTYNKLRQASITTELIEITSGAEALKS